MYKAVYRTFVYFSINGPQPERNHGTPSSNTLKGANRLKPHPNPTQPNPTQSNPFVCSTTIQPKPTYCSTFKTQPNPTHMQIQLKPTQPNSLSPGSTRFQPMEITVFNMVSEENERFLFSELSTNSRNKK